jgi:hypothetical protein
MMEISRHSFLRQNDVALEDAHVPSLEGRVRVFGRFINNLLWARDVKELAEPTHFKSKRSMHTP